MHWDDLHWEKSYNNLYAYNQSKLANLLHAKELARRMEPHGVSVYVLHPGVIKTELARHVDRTWYGRVVMPLVKMTMLTPLEV